MRDKVIIIGAGGHAKVVIEIFRAMLWSPAYCVADTDSRTDCLGVPILRGDGNLGRLRREGYSTAFVAIGSNQTRQRMAEIATSQGFTLINAISPAASISPSAKIGRGVAIMPGAVINAESIIHDLAIINTGATIDHDCRIGHAAHIAPQAGLAGNVIVGTGTLLGIGCKVIPRIRIGDDVTVGAGAVVVRDIPSGSFALGVPAKLLPRTCSQNA